MEHHIAGDEAEQVLQVIGLQTFQSGIQIAGCLRGTVRDQTTGDQGADGDSG